jgi:coenzyme PQQ synthesis protein D (PqqD)
MRFRAVSVEPAMHLEIRPRRKDHVIARNGEHELMLLDVESGCYYTLNEVGGRIWELCDGSWTVAEIVATLSAEYEAPSETVRVDVLELLTDLERERLLEHD